MWNYCASRRQLQWVLEIWTSTAVFSNYYTNVREASRTGYINGETYRRTYHHFTLFTPRALRSWRSEEEYMTTMYILRTDDRVTDQRPTTDLAFWKISNGHISATDHLIHLIFSSRAGFSRSADRMSLLSVGPNPRSRPSAVLYNFEWP